MKKLNLITDHAARLRRDRRFNHEPRKLSGLMNTNEEDQIRVDSRALMVRASVSRRLVCRSLGGGGIAISYLAACFALAACALCQVAQAVVPPPDGGYPGFNTAEGTRALQNLTTGVGNAAVGWYSLFSNTDGSYNTALGAGTLLFNVGNQSTGEGTQNTAVGTVALLFNSTGQENTALGVNALGTNTAGSFNTAAGVNALSSNTDGYENSAFGWGALASNTAGFQNTATGVDALFNNTTGSGNTATGDRALLNNTEGNENTATGILALGFNTEGDANTANGVSALFSNTTGSFNTAIGRGALHDNTDGDENTAIGNRALEGNVSGSYNTAVGNQALSNTQGSFNTATGFLALASNPSGSENTAIGVRALLGNGNTGVGNTAIGFRALELNSAGSYNTVIGHQALQNNTSGSYNIVLVGGANLTTGDFNIDIGNNGEAGDANTIRIGNPLHNRAFIAGIYGATASGGTAVYINSAGQLGTATSAARFKEEIQSMGDASEAILALRPVSFRYKKEIDPQGIPQFGLVAEEVEKINPDLVVRDAGGRAYTVRYEQINAMLLNEFLKAYKRVQDLERTVVQQQKRLDEQAAQIQRVSAQVQTNRPATKVAINQP